VAHPQIAAFARLANGGQAPARALYGQASKLSRTMHDVRYNEVRDEIVVPVPYADAILTFRGGADGQEAPIRVIQGPKTGEVPMRLDIDPIHNEVFLPDGNRIRVYPLDANGDVAPIRILEGPDTQLANVESLAVDPVNNILVVGFHKNKSANNPDGTILVFNRTDSGNVKPRAVIHGPKTGIVRINQMAVYPPKRLIVATMPGNVDMMESPEAFLGVWTYDDQGDIEPKWKFPIGPKTTLKKPFGVVLNPKHKEVIISDMRLNGVVVFSAPEIF
jgi:hypothetical protein